MIKRGLTIILIGLLTLMSVGVVAAQDEQTAEPFVGVRYNEDADGVVVTEVVPDSPADEAGLQVDDVITAIDDTEVSVNTFADTVLAYEPGDTVTLMVLRDDEEQQIELTLGEAPAQMESRRPGDRFGQGVERPFLGIGLEDGENGVEITQVQPESPANEAGLEAGDVISAVDGETVENRDDVVAAIGAKNPGDEVTLTITRDGEEQEITATLGSTFEARGGPGAVPFAPGDFIYLPEQSAWEVGEIAEDSEFYQSGLRPGDLITAINGETYSEDSIINLLDLLNSGAAVTLTVERDGETTEIETSSTIILALLNSASGDGTFMLPPGQAPFPGVPFGQPPLPELPVRLGVGFIMLDEQVAEEFQVEQTEGALIQEVAPRSPGDRAGLQVGDVVTAVNGETLTLENNLRDALVEFEPGEEVTFDVIRDGEALELTATLGQPLQSTEK